MSRPNLITLILLSAIPVLIAGGTPAGAAESNSDLCDLVLQEERLELDELQLEVDLARSALAAYEQIYGLIEELWENEATERMVYLESLYDRDAARVTLEQADLIVLRQEAFISHIDLSCRPPGDGQDRKVRIGALREARSRYREAHCRSLQKSAEAAEIRLSFNRELLARIRELRAGRVATRPDVILAELGVENEEKRLEDANIRVKVCRDESRPD